MKTSSIPVFFCSGLVVLGAARNHAPAGAVCPVSARVEHRASGQGWTERSHDAWVRDALQRMQAVKVGMTRDEFERIFREDGGLLELAPAGSKVGNGRYVFRECNYFKVDVEFELVGWRSSHQAPRTQALAPGTQH